MRMAECTGLALVNLVRVEKPSRWLTGTSKGWDMWYGSKALNFNYTLKKIWLSNMRVMTWARGFQRVARLQTDKDHVLEDSNPTIESNRDQNVIKEWTVILKEDKVKIRIIVTRETIGDLLLENKLFKMLRGRNTINSMGGIMCEVNVGLRAKIMVVAIVEVSFLRISAVNLIRLLACQTLWLIPNNKPKRIWEVLEHMVRSLMIFGVQIFTLTMGRQTLICKQQMDTFPCKISKWLNQLRILGGHHHLRIRVRLILKMSGFMDNSILPLASEVLPTQVAPKEGQRSMASTDQCRYLWSKKYWTRSFAWSSRLSYDH